MYHGSVMNYYFNTYFFSCVLFRNIGYSIHLYIKKIKKM